MAEPRRDILREGHTSTVKVDLKKLPKVKDPGPPAAAAAKDAPKKA